MKYRKLGSTGIKVSEIGFGTWGIGGLTDGNTSYGKTKDDVSSAALKKAYKNGVTFYDTASVYGDGNAEFLIGDALGDVRKKIVIATKTGLTKFGAPQDWYRFRILQSLEDSLKRLRTDYVDLLLLHDPPPEVFVQYPQLKAFMRRLMATESIRYWGVSAKSPSDAIQMLSHHDIPIIEVNLNMLDVRAIDSNLLDMCKQRGIGVIARTPLCFGFLSGEVTVKTKFKRGDHRNAWSTKQIKAWSEGADLVHKSINKFVPKETKAQSALRFCLSFPSVSCVIPGIMTPKEADDDARVSALGALPKEATQRILEINHERQFFA